MEVARYGRMELGRCVSKDYGHIGMSFINQIDRSDKSNRSQLYIVGSCHISCIKMHDSYLFMIMINHIFTY